MKQLENKIMLITYPDSLGGSLRSLEAVVNRYLKDAVGGIHILPFYPSSGDRGFAVVEYGRVDPAWGTWEDIDRLADRYALAADFMLNHISSQSKEFRDYMAKGDDSEYRDMFIRWDEFWPDGEPSQQELDALYRRRPGGGPFHIYIRDDGKEVKLWNTFFEQQVDINPFSKAAQDYYDRNLGEISRHVPLIRFDAFAYASKKPGTSCFFVEPEIWDVLDIAMKPLRKTGTQMLAEIHENYRIQQKMAERGYWVYDFALPMLLLHATITGRSDRLIHWMNICPRNQFTTLDTHDGVGVIDAAGLLEEEEIETVAEKVESRTALAQKYIQNGSMIRKGGKKAVRYQLAGTFYSIMDCNDDAYLLARAVQYFAPGIPQVYYVGMLAGENDIEFVKNGGEGRGLNRHNYTIPEIEQAVMRPVVQRLLKLSKFRNSHPAFSGDFWVDGNQNDGILHIVRTCSAERAELIADFSVNRFKILFSEAGKMQEFIL
jgi:sucrose phosphorylase